MTQSRPTLPQKTLPVSIPPQILQWLRENDRCKHSDLVNSLLQAGHPPERSLGWVVLYFERNFTPGPEMDRVAQGLWALHQADLEKLAKSWTAANGQTQLVVNTGGHSVDLPYPHVSLKATQGRVRTLDNAQSATDPMAARYVPDGNFGPLFPNTLQSSDLGRHPIGLYCTSPRVLQVFGVLTDEECDFLIEGSRPTLKRSTVVSRADGGEFSVEDNSRTSFGSHFDRGSSPQIRTIENRLSEIFRFPVMHGESLQILNYSTGAEYKPHYDYFEATEAGRQAMSKGGNRCATIILYLNDVAQGGATVFPNAHLNVMPVKGSAVYFDYILPSGLLDGMSLHGGAPVLEGEKWIATKWVREYPWG